MEPLHGCNPTKRNWRLNLHTVDTGERSSEDEAAAAGELFRKHQRSCGIICANISRNQPAWESQHCELIEGFSKVEEDY
ncbi:hypothetical protein FNV43_RR25235 [Rhamnella rubrinervis]|uniref:Uncharacterized protein n=1 Tax=Rhamnella rubrinervis TaxID=2594499 RepID=A0A8K0DMZ8_9ROSA|nr:hypothetical protein FNV43_RR25235 [Rhamnella rubrinervis]